MVLSPEKLDAHQSRPQQRPLAQYCTNFQYTQIIRSEIEALTIAVKATASDSLPHPTAHPPALVGKHALRRRQCHHAACPCNLDLHALLKPAWGTQGVKESTNCTFVYLRGVGE